MTKPNCEKCVFKKLICIKFKDIYDYTVREVENGMKEIFHVFLVFV